MDRIKEKPSERLQECIENCFACYELSTKAASYCVSRGGKYLAPAHFTLLLHCAEICRTSAHFLLTSSAFHAWACGLCAEVCKKCFQECEAFPGDEMLTFCAQTCRECAQACREMASNARAA